MIAIDASHRLASAAWVSTAALIVVPKCFACVTAYIAAGAATATLGREICGGPLVSAAPDSLYAWASAAVALLNLAALRWATGHRACC
jgi:hypothetical protein